MEPLETEHSSDQLDVRIARALRTHIDELAMLAVSHHKERYPSHVHADDEHLLVRAKKAIDEVIDAIEHDAAYVVHAYDIGDVAKAMATCAPTTLNAEMVYGAFLELEHSVLPYLWDEFDPDTTMLLSSVLRFHVQLVKFIRADLDRLSDAFTATSEHTDNPVQLEQRLKNIKRLDAIVAQTLHDAESRIEHIYDYTLAAASVADGSMQ